MAVLRKDGFSDLTRGSDTWWHEIKLIFNSLVLMSIIFSVIFLVVWLYFIFQNTDKFERDASIAWIESQVYMDFNDYEHLINITWKDGKRYQITAGKLEQNATVYKSYLKVKKISFEAMLIGIYSAGTILFFLIIFWYRRGYLFRKNKMLRGKNIVDTNTLNKLIDNNKDKKALSLAGVNLPNKSEVKNFFFSGSVGSGKSVSIMGLMDQVRERNERAIIYDSTGEFTKYYYRDGIDIVLNPFDKRFPGWSVWQEIIEEYDYASMGQSLYPEPKSNEPFWNDTAREVFIHTIMKLKEKGMDTNEQMLEMLMYKSLSQLNHFLKGTPAQNFTDPDAEKMALGIRASVTKVLPPFEFLNAGKGDFSITNWVKKEPSPSEQAPWIFITSLSDQHQLLRPLITMWIDIAVRSILSLTPDRDRRIWTYLDEIDSLGKLQSLKDLLTRGRKHGSCVVIGLQMISQFREVYGKDLAQTLSGMCNTRLTLNNPDPETAKWLSDAIGKKEIEEAKESVTFGSERTRDSMSINKDRKEKELVMPSEIMNLEERTGFLKIPGSFPIGRVSFDYIQRQEVANDYEIKSNISRLITIKNKSDNSKEDKQNKEPEQSKNIAPIQTEFDIEKIASDFLDS